MNSFSTSNPVQGPVADDADYDLLGAYVQDRIAVTEKFELTLGLRVNHAAADADRVQDPTSGEATSLSDDWTSLVGSARFLHRLCADRVNLYGGVSQGFRAPNLTDLTRFDSQRTNEVEIPAPGLEPEYYTMFELGVKGKGRRYSFQFAAFFTDIRDQITVFPTGATNSNGEFEVTKANIGDGWVKGLEAAGSFRLGEGWTLFGNLAFLEGEVDTFPTSAQVKTREYLDRLMPLTAQLGVRWEESRERFWAEAIALLVDKADKLGTRDRQDTDRIPPGGTPGYGVIEVRGGWKISRNARLILAVENVLDRAYRTHGSGITMPGRNFTLSFSLDF